MALSNIFREPRRELTETAVGLFVAAPLCWGWYLAADSFARSGACGQDCDSYAEGFVVGIMLTGIVGVIGIAVILLCAFGIHTMGEGICNALERRGVHLRPRRRR